MDRNTNEIINVGSPGEGSITPDTPSLAGNESLSTLSTTSVPSISDDSQVNLPINEDSTSEASTPQEDRIFDRLRDHYAEIRDISEEVFEIQRQSTGNLDPAPQEAVLSNIDWTTRINDHILIEHRGVVQLLDTDTDGAYSRIATNLEVRMVENMTSSIIAADEAINTSNPDAIAEVDRERYNILMENMKSLKESHDRLIDEHAALQQYSDDSGENPDDSDGNSDDSDGNPDDSGGNPDGSEENPGDSKKDYDDRHTEKRKRENSDEEMQNESKRQKTNEEQGQSSGSLIDDFADPNLDMPSYIDPED